jgi:hypothetical protein
MLCDYEILSVCRILTEESSRKYLTLLVNALSHCAVFLAAKSRYFDEKLVHKFCAATLEECEKPEMIQHLPEVRALAN